MANLEPLNANYIEPLLIQYLAHFNKLMEIYQLIEIMKLYIKE